MVSARVRTWLSTDVNRLDGQQIEHRISKEARRKGRHLVRDSCLSPAR
jgi:hypothetical protein